MPSSSETPSVPAAVEDLQTTYKRGVDFWMVYVSNLMVDMLSVLDVTATPTALPTIVDQLHGTDFIWVGSAYTIASTAVIPVVGDLALSFGRKPVLIAFILIFAVGSAICGAAQSMNMLIAGRAIQGFAGGGCLSITEIIYADMVPLPERGKFQALIASVWAIGSALGPPVGGALANAGQWRWLFLLNLPLCAIALVLTTVFLRVHTPRFDMRKAAERMDWIGILIMVGSALSVLVAITWGGIQFPWASGHVLPPLIVGSVGILSFFAYERVFSGQTVPSHFFTSRTTFGGYLGTFFHGITSLCSIFYLPVYFQAVQDNSAIVSGVDIFPLTLTLPVSAIVAGRSVKRFRRYLPQNYIGWILSVAGFVVLSTVDENSTRAQYIGTQVFPAFGVGMIWVATQFPILAPMPVSNNAHALAFHIFLRRFAQTFGIAVGGTVIQNVLLKKLPEAFLDSLPGGVEIAYSAIPRIKELPEQLKGEVHHAFAQAMRTVWLVMVGVSGAGLLSCLLLREEEMRTDMDERWGLQERKRDASDSIENADVKDGASSEDAVE